MPERPTVRLDSSIPMMGAIAFGIIDRGTNLIQVRPTSICPLSCIFCSTDAGPRSKGRAAEYVVDDLDWLLAWFRSVASWKGGGAIEAHIDTVGDPLTYPHLLELIQRLREVPEVRVISMQTHGALLTERLADELAAAGLDRINLSIDATEPSLARRLANTPWYDVRRIMEVARHIAENTSMDLLIAPVWIPGLNDAEIPKLIDFALGIGAGKRWPPLGIQKFVAHKRGRRPKGIRPMGWSSFYDKLRELSDRFGVQLRLWPEDFGIHKTRRVPTPFKRGEIIRVEVVAEGWLRGEKLAVDLGRKRAITLVRARNLEIGSKVKARILQNKDNIYLAEPIPR